MRSNSSLPFPCRLAHIIVTHVTQPLIYESCDPPLYMWLSCRAQGRKVGELTGHSKRVTDAKFLGHQDLMVTTSADKTSRLWAVDGDAYKCKVSCPHCLKLCFRKSPERAPFSCFCLAACCVTLMLSCLSGVENGHQLRHTWLILPLAADSDVSSCYCIQD